MYPRSVAEGVFPHHRLVGLYGHARNAAHHAACGVELVSVGVGGHVHVVFPGVDGHDDFFNRRVARPFSYSVDATFHLAGARLHCGKAVGHGKAEVVVAMYAESRSVDVGHGFLYVQ